ncbi:MAG: putative selenate reductase subunit YgfK [Sphaerochaeta sp.]|uniref:putative selenate reductase subunit YgfK n=1 Tax=Sphaerochaeta sp. TaxID=1972642 RepID=UPI001D303894|nr:putative selenate reductase subunit YgfK [uncultured Sphaerochaeta sp.]MDD3929337.1 putative selenate reductase subunit YgfK [Sphaerochaeta sp.]NCC88959.1 putative selenate reductase subunit YgfK [Spirochaetia bacterium]
MGDIMRPVPFSELISRIVGEYRNHHAIFGIAEEQFYQDAGKHSLSVFNQSCSTPVGPAAGPHTQLAQNIIASYLVGGRFIELKTVQVMDTLEIEKPCIDARDEAYNVEWSTEFTLPKAWDEYAKAWIILHVLEAAMHKGKFEKPSFIFNMSVGYNLEGIKTAKMQQYIDSMIDARKDERFNEYLKELEAMLDEGLFEGTPWEGLEKKLKGISTKISANISPSTTLSTMHGCPPKEIEAICTYMLTEKKVDTFVKLNPTLLGFDAVRKILDDLGFDYITLTRENFEHDLQYTDAIAMLHRLVDLAKKEGRGFGVKLTNTLGSVNDQGVLPGNEMYMSGRSLLPISTTVATLLSKEFGGKLPISYSGGATAFTVKDLFESGIRPITLATDMLKPGGYTRLKQMVEILNTSKAWSMDGIDVKKVEKLSETSRTTDFEVTGKEFRGEDTIKIGEKLPLFDCYVAPCQVACPIHQDVPEYVQLVGQGRYGEALALIYDKNALPAITGHICDHQCQLHCTRMDYEGAVHIRDLKRIAVENGFDEYKSMWEGPTDKTDVKAAVIGAGPAGLSAAYFLARAGFDTSVFEREESAGGVVRHVIPGFRLPVEAIESDVEFIKAHGVQFNFGVETEKMTVEALRNAGYSYIFYAIGSEVDNDIPLVGDRSRVRPSLSFLASFRKDPSTLSLGKNVVVVGGGNTAMDSARAALRIPGVEKVSVIYRRTENEMPADLEEYGLARKEHIDFIFLANPERFDGNVLTVRKMALGEKDSSGRRRPVATDETFTLEADTMITAIGEHADTEKLTWYGVPVNEKGWPISNEETKESKMENVYVIGDAQSGPSTVVRCIASARSAVEAAIDKVLGPEEDEEEGCGCGHDHDEDHECTCEDGCDCDDDDDEEMTDEERVELEKDENEFFAEVADKKRMILPSKKFGDKEFAATEAARCLECSYLCNKCVDVCPNRANVAIDVRNTGVFSDPFQILHLDAYCNECGNCETFCPYDGGPYRKKFTLFSLKEDFENSENSGFYAEGEDILIRLDGKIYNCSMDADGILTGDEEGVTDEVAALIGEVYTSYSYLLGYVEA